MPWFSLGKRFRHAMLDEVSAQDQSTVTWIDVDGLDTRTARPAYVHARSGRGGVATWKSPEVNVSLVTFPIRHRQRGDGSWEAVERWVRVWRIGAVRSGVTVRVRFAWARSTPNGRPPTPIGDEAVVAAVSARSDTSWWLATEAPERLHTRSVAGESMRRAEPAGPEDFRVETVADGLEIELPSLFAHEMVQIQLLRSWSLHRLSARELLDASDFPPSDLLEIAGVPDRLVPASPIDPETGPVTPEAAPIRLRPMPGLRQRRHPVGRHYAADEADRLRLGSAHPDDPWFVVHTDGHLCFHRAATGVCVFAARLDDLPDGGVTWVDLAVNVDLYEVNDEGATPEGDVGWVGAWMDARTGRTSPTGGEA